MVSLFSYRGSSMTTGSSAALRFYRKFEKQRKMGHFFFLGCKEEGGAALMCTESLACDSAPHLRTM